VVRKLPTAGRVGDGHPENRRRVGTVAGRGRLHVAIVGHDAVGRHFILSQIDIRVLDDERVAVFPLAIAGIKIQISANELQRLVKTVWVIFLQIQTKLQPVQPL
jgi:hypothetical protein